MCKGCSYLMSDCTPEEEHHRQLVSNMEEGYFVVKTTIYKRPISIHCYSERYDRGHSCNTMMRIDGEFVEISSDSSPNAITELYNYMQEKIDKSHEREVELKKIISEKQINELHTSIHSFYRFSNLFN